ncbi:hypothetical protein BMS3Abin16_01856 [archaeon BMS3Abin16]|nr:hypothetical protein BMS3Abin16_01856 [archaeon BMS3Abin16]
MVQCNECGSKLKKGDSFCSQCGAKIAVLKAQAKPVKTRSKSVGKKTVKPSSVKKSIKSQAPSEPVKKEGAVDLTDDVKRRLKAELEISIKAFKRGDITLEEFQDIKKSIVAKARAGFYNASSGPLSPAPTSTPKAVPPPVPSPMPAQFEPEPFVPAYTIPEPSLRRTSDPAPTGDLYKPMRRLDEPLFSKLWYLAPVIFNLIGGLIAYFAIKPSDEKSAKKMLAIGAVSFILVAAGAGYYSYTTNFFGGQKDVAPPPTGIVIEGVETVETLAPAAVVVPISASNASAAEMNLALADLGGGFSVNNVLSGTLKDPLEFAGGDRVFADTLAAQGWLENNRAFFTKEASNAANKTFVEWEIDSSISKYNASKTSKTYFDDRLAGFETTFSQNNYSLIDFDVGEAGVMVKKVESDSEFGLKVSYRVFFYEKDAFVSLMVSKVGRGLEEEDVVGFATTIAQRIN